VVWLAFTVMSLKRERDNAQPRAHIEPDARVIALIESNLHQLAAHGLHVHCRGGKIIDSFACVQDVHHHSI
jgi:hypothetical protein